jgi:putative transposase
VAGTALCQQGGRNQPPQWPHGRARVKTLKPFIRRSFADLQPGDIYSADGHTFDAEVQHPLHGRPSARKSPPWWTSPPQGGGLVGGLESALVVLDALRDA